MIGFREEGSTIPSGPKDPLLPVLSDKVPGETGRSR